MKTAIAFLSNKAFDRFLHDRFVHNRINAFIIEIMQIVQNARLQKNVQTIGDFRVSPLGNKHQGIRVAWHFERQGDEYTYYIDDLLYQEAGDRYVDDWATKATKGIVSKRDYIKSGYRRYDIGLLS